MSAPITLPALPDVTAWVEHHKAGDNLWWDHPGEKCSALFTADQLQAYARECVDIEQMLRDCIPGGHSVDPQAVCDKSGLGSEVRRCQCGKVC